MNFGHVKMLWIAAVILPLLALFIWVTWRRRQALIRYFVQNKNLSELTLGTSTTKQKVRRLLLFLGVAALLFTTARPQWGFAWEEATQRGRDILDDMVERCPIVRSQVIVTTSPSLPATRRE